MKLLISIIVFLALLWVLALFCFKLMDQAVCRAASPEVKQANCQEVK